MNSSEQARAGRNLTPGGLVWFDQPAPPRATPQLSRDRVVAAAIELADRQPTGEITMRALATELGVRSPMALYRYVGSKEGLTDLMTDQVYGQLMVARGDGWRAALRGLGRSGWAAVQRHPWFARLAFSRPPLGPHALGIYDAALAELEPPGLALLEEQAMRARTGLTTDADLDRAAAPYLERIAAAGAHPHFSRWAADPGRDAAGFPRFEQVLDWVLDGLASTLPPG
jgi:AcrR family transcriptional regulator